MILWEVERIKDGVKAVVKAETHEEMITELKRIGFKSILTEKAQKRCIIDIMTAITDEGTEFIASEYVHCDVIKNDVKTLPEINLWPKGKETK